MTCNVTVIFVPDVEPWLTVATGCTFPLPWANATQTPKPPSSTETNATEPEQQTQSSTNIAQQRPLTDYVGSYEHLAFGNFTVYVKDDSLRYKFGVTLHGPLEASETRDKFLMKLEHPYVYLTYIFPNGRQGFPVYFSESGRNAGKVDEIKVPFMEPSVAPPMFKQYRSTTTPGTGSVSMCKASLTAMSLAVLLAAFLSP